MLSAEGGLENTLATARPIDRRDRMDREIFGPPIVPMMEQSWVHLGNISFHSMGRIVLWVAYTVAIGVGDITHHREAGFRCHLSSTGTLLK